MTKTLTVQPPEGNAVMQIVAARPVDSRGYSTAEARERFAHYPDSCRDSAIRLNYIYITRCKGDYHLVHRVAKSVAIENTAPFWQQVCTGQYFKQGGDATKLRESLRKVLDWFDRQDRAGRIPFVETENWNRIRDYIDSRRGSMSVCRFGAIEGLTGAQKTESGKHYCELGGGHPLCLHIESPAAPTRSRFVRKLSKGFLVPATYSLSRQEIEVEKSFTTETLLFLDNVQRLFHPRVAPEQQPIFNYLHELQDELGFTVIFTWVPTFRRVITGADPFWEQFLGRIGGEENILRVEQKLPKKDLLAFARAYAVADDRNALPILEKWASTRLGLRVLNGKLQAARILANQAGAEEITIDFLGAVDADPTLGRIPAEKEGE